jgi:hypothetical protein
MGGDQPEGFELAGSRSAGDERNVAAVDAKVVQFAGREPAEFGNGLAVTAPVVVRADEVHFGLPFETVWSLSTIADHICRNCPKKERWFRNAALRTMHNSLIS